jgi:hypothetical protein
MTTENSAAKGVTDRILTSRQIAVNRHRNRMGARIGIASGIGPYLALNWHRIEIELQHPSADRGFPTPVPAARGAENVRGMDALLTTSHLFWPNERRKPGFLLPIRLPNRNSFSQMQPTRPRGGRGVRRSIGRKWHDRKPRTEFSAKWVPCSIRFASQKNSLDHRYQFLAALRNTLK